MLVVQVLSDQCVGLHSAIGVHFRHIHIINEVDELLGTRRAIVTTCMYSYTHYTRDSKIYTLKYWAKSWFSCNFVISMYVHTYSQMFLCISDINIECKSMPVQIWPSTENDMALKSTPVSNRLRRMSVSHSSHYHVHKYVHTSFLF